MASAAHPRALGHEIFHLHSEPHAFIIFFFLVEIVMAPTQLDLAESHDLTDSQIDDLLKRAEERLRDPGGLALQAQDSQQFARSRKLETSGLPKPYIETNGDIAHADPRRLVENTTRVQANGIRKVEDPLTTKKRKLEVSLPTQ